MTRSRRSVAALLLLLVALFGFVSPIRAGAIEERGVIGLPPRGVNTYSLQSVSDTSVSSYKSGAMLMGGVMTYSKTLRINGTVYIPLSDFVNTYVKGAKVRYDSGTRTITVSGNGFDISVSDGAYALFAGGRAFFSRTPSRLMSDGKIYVPISLVARAFSLEWRVSEWGTAIFEGRPVQPKLGAEFYDEDAVYWLARIISAESRGEPLIGQIAVGNVVMNRVRSSAFPNTIWGVIFDRKWGVQFSPVLDGTIYNTPTQSSILAAKIVLDGFTVSDELLYFLHPEASTSSWIIHNREFRFVIGKHYFFA